MNMDRKDEQNAILVGNSFPLSLIRHDVIIRPGTLEQLRETLRGKDIHSFWGHANTLAAASAMAGADLTPATERPTLTLSPDALPALDGEIFHECWVLSPDYAPGFRPRVGEEVPEDAIMGWQVLKLTWSDSL